MKQQKEGTWWSRNWKWLVPVGCLGAIVLFLAFIAILLSLAIGFIKSSTVYKEPVAMAKVNPSVVEAMGTPIEEGLFVTGKANIEGPSGNAAISIPISGPKGKGTIYVVATKSAGRWTFTTLDVEINDSGTRINLLENRSYF